MRTWQALTGTYKQRAVFTIDLNGGIDGSSFYDLNAQLGILSFSMTDLQVVNMVLAALLEPPLESEWIGTGQFNFNQIVNALQNRINRWMGDTGANITRHVQMVGTGPTAARIFIPDSVPDAPSQPVTFINVRDVGAKGNGAADDRVAINSAIAQACAAGKDLYFPAGNYLVSAPLSKIGCSLTVFGDGSANTTIKLGGPGPSLYSALLNFVGGAKVTVHDIALDGRNVAAPGLYLINVGTATVYNVIVRNFGTPGFSAGHNNSLDGIYAAAVQNLVVANSIITGNERSGVEMIPVQNAIISGNLISGNGYYGAASEWLAGNDPTNTHHPANIQYLNNIVRSNGSGGLDVETGTGLPACYGKIIGNDIEDCGNDMWGYGIGAVIGNNAYGEISGNTVKNFNASGPQFPGYGSAVVATPNGLITIIGNAVSGARGDGIRVIATEGAIQDNYSWSNGGQNFNISCAACMTNPNFTTAPPAGAGPVMPPAPSPSANPPQVIVSPVTNASTSVLDIRRAAWISTSGMYSTLWRDDEFAMQAFKFGGNLTPADPPIVWGKFSIPPVGLEVYPVPANPGEIETLVVNAGPQIGTTPAAIVANPTVLHIPEDFTYGMVFGALADLCAADGPMRDLDRAQYAESRYQESVELYRLNPTLLMSQIDGVQVWTGSVFEMDSFLASWQTKPGLPQFVGMAGRNLVAFGPTPSRRHSVTMDVVGNIPLPAADGDFLQVDRGALNPLLDYAQHLASWKMAGTEFHNTDRLRVNFYMQAGMENQRITQGNFYRSSLQLPAFRQQQEVPRINSPQPQQAQPQGSQ